MGRVSRLALESCANTREVRPRLTDAPARQRIRYVRSRDGAKLAWAETGEGPILVKASNWLTHLDYEWDSPVWRHWIRFLGSRFRLVRFDERGSGMSDWNVVDLAFERWLEDLEAVVEAARPEGPFTLLGISQGASVAIEYAVRHPERVSRLLLYGGYARGWGMRGDAEAEKRNRAIADLTRYGWGNDNPVFRQLFTSRFIPGGTDQQIAWFNELCRRTTTPENAERFINSRGLVDVRARLAEVRVPTLVVHARHDAVVPISEGTLLAAEIPDAQFVELDSPNHVLLDGEPAWRRFQEAVLEFVGLAATSGEDPAFATLSTREREVLALITEGLANAQIASRLDLSEKTVRNHLSNVFDKLGVYTRAQAIVFARDRGFKAVGSGS